MKKLIRKILVIMALAVIAIPLTSNAGFQSNKGGTSYTVTNSIYANVLFDGIRKMETEGGTLGLTADLQPTTYLDTTGNGLDCHMAKNTEWGTAAMLAASIYGEAPSGQSEESTTGNDSGIFQMANGNGLGGKNSKGHELVAGIFNTSSQYISTIKNADQRYYDLYTDSTSKPGDATTETSGWKGATQSAFVGGSYSIFQRDYKGLFGFYHHSGSDWDGFITNYSGTYAGARAVVVCGEGL